MTIRQAIDQLQATKPCGYDEAFMVRWLSRCEALLDQQVLKRYDKASTGFIEFDENTDMDTELIAQEPHDALYLYFLEAQVNYADGDIAQYNNSMTMFNSELELFRREIQRRYRPLRKKRFFF